MTYSGIRTGLLTPNIGTRCLACLVLRSQNTLAAGRTFGYVIPLRKDLAYLSLKCGSLGELPGNETLRELGLLCDALRCEQVDIAKLVA